MLPAAVAIPRRGAGATAVKDAPAVAAVANPLAWSARPGLGSAPGHVGEWVGSVRHPLILGRPHPWSSL
jgi:hypothetical protein